MPQRFVRSLFPVTSALLGTGPDKTRVTKVHRADWPLRSCIGGERGPYRLVTSGARVRCPVAFLASSDRLVLEKLDTSPRNEIVVEVDAAREDARRVR